MSVQIIVFFCLALVAGTYSKVSRVVNGAYADITDFPFHAALKRISDNKHLCGGAIVTKFNILTVAHCLIEPFVSHANLKVVVGTSNISETNGISYIPDRIFIHPKFTGDLEDITSFHNDIALLRTDGEIEFNEFVGPIDLPLNNVRNGDIGILSGWGSPTHPHVTISNVLRKIWLRIIDFPQCRKMLPFTMRSDQFCAFQRAGAGPCVGDSGGPLVNLNHVVGLVSIVRPCATGVPDVYTNVFSHIEFIKFAANLLD